MKIRKRTATLAVVAAVVTGFAATAAISATGSSSATQAGGTYRVGWESAFGFDHGLDPTGEYVAEAWAIFSQLMLRRLVSYNHVPGGAGNVIVPDIAKAVPKPTNGGLTYTFRMKSGIKFGPPVNREVTSKDIVTALERVARPKHSAGYGFYYTVIKGFTEFGAGKAKSIAGIKTPNAKTISFTLTAPTGDFLNRIAMPATAPLPGEVTKCFEGKPNVYGRNVVSTGPYMFEGSDQVDISSCASIKPVSGWDGATKVILVRNPSYDPKTDSKEAREALPDRFEFLVNTNADDIYNKVAAGELDDQIASPSAKVLREYTTDASKRSRFKSYSGDQVNYITMNLTQPPFDDLYIRRAMNFVMDKEGLRKAYGGATQGPIANHIVPDALFGGQLKAFAPYKSAGDAGDVAKAKAEVKKSKYANNDGVCSAPECKNVLFLTDIRVTDKAMLPVIQASAAKIGITFKVRSVTGAYPILQTPANNIPISSRPRWGKDYADALTFIGPLFDGRNLIPSGNINYSLVGITPEQAATLKVKGTVDGVPSVDADIDRCSALGGDARVGCWMQVDRKLTTQVVPWIPYLWRDRSFILSANVTKWTYDQFSASPSWAHVAVKG